MRTSTHFHLMSSQSLEAMFRLNIPEFNKCVLRGADHTVLAIDEQDTGYSPLMSTEAGFTCL